MEKLVRDLKESITYPLTFVGILWIQLLMQYIFGLHFGAYGILPRHTDSLVGIITAPMVHADYAHLLSNSIPLLVFGVAIFYFYRNVALQSLLLIYIFTGLAVWGFARSGSYHIGASGVVYGMWAFILGMGIFQRNIKSIALALLMISFYGGGMVAGMLPDQPGISWESHLFGALVGTIVAYGFRHEIYHQENDMYAQKVENLPTQEEYFLPIDTFDKWRKQEKEKF